MFAMAGGPNLVWSLTKVIQLSFIMHAQCPDKAVLRFAYAVY